MKDFRSVKYRRRHFLLHLLYHGVKWAASWETLSFGVCDQVKIQTGLLIYSEILDLESTGIMLSSQQTTKALIRLRKCLSLHRRSRTVTLHYSQTVRATMFIYEQQYDKPTNWPVCPDSDQPGHPPVWSVFSVRMRKHWVLSTERTGHIVGFVVLWLLW